MARKFNDAIDLAANELQNVVMQNLGSDPGTGVVDGRLYYSTALNQLRLRAGGAWTSIASGAGYTDEQAQDASAALFAAGTHTGITATYDDVGNALSLAVQYGAVTAQTSFGAASANGSANTAARSDHTHGTPANPVSYATPGLSFGTANAAGAASTLIRSDATLAIFDTTAPTTSAVGDAAAVGTAAFAARRDHVHAREAFATNTIALGTAAAAGSATTLIRSDATIAAFDATAPTTSAPGDAAATGSAAFAARRDHVHGREAVITKNPVRAATTAAGTLASSFANGQAIDGVTLATGDRILIKNQATASENGIYVVTAGTPTRATDADASAEVTTGMTVVVSEGTANADTMWELSTNGAITLGTTGLTFIEIAGPVGATPTTSAVGDAAAAGTATTLARSDHTHGREAFATNTIALGTAAAAGSAATLIRSDATIAAFDATAPTTLAFGGAAATGSAAFAARRDHSHGMPANPVSYATPGLTLGTANAAGAAATLIRSDATIAIFDTTAPSTLAYGGAAAVGSVAFAARRDHAHGMPTHAAGDHSAFSLSTFGAPTADVGWGGFKITNLGTPTAATDAANKSYVDSISAGLDPKASVRAASTANVTVTYTATAGASGRGQITAAPNTLDGVTLVAGDRILLKDQTAPAQNGIWVVTTLGTGANGVWDRAPDFDSDAEVTAGAFMWVTEGTTNADSGWTLATNDPIVIGGASGTSLTFVQFSGAGQITAGAGLTKTGNTIDAQVGGGIEIASDTIRLAAAAAGTGLTGGAGSNLAVNTGAGLEISGSAVRIATTAAGTGLTGGGGSALAVNHTVVPYLFVATLTGGAAFEDVTHNLGTKDVIVQVYNLNTPFADEEFSVEHKTTNVVTIRSATTIPASTYRVVILG